MLSADPEIWRQLAQRIAELRQDRVDMMAQGGCHTFEEYQRAVGYVRALDDVVGTAQDIFGRMRGQFEENEE